MRVAALYDVHGNLPALEAVLAELDDDPPDAIVAGGDVVWGPFPAECLELLRGRVTYFVAGNTERLTLARHDEQHAWVLDRLDEEQRSFVESWPATVELDVEGLGHVIFCHATPRSDEEILTRLTPADVVAEALAGVGADVIVCGHVHSRYERHVGGLLLVNAGSVGMPYEGERGAYWTLLGPRVEPRRTEYDVEAAFERLVATGFERAAELFQSSLVAPASPDEVAAHFERVAGRGA